LHLARTFITLLTDSQNTDSSNLRCLRTLAAPHTIIEINVIRGDICGNFPPPNSGDYLVSVWRIPAHLLKNPRQSARSDLIRVLFHQPRRTPGQRPAGVLS
jgi:hypothetical protein